MPIFALDFVVGTGQQQDHTEWVGGEREEMEAGEATGTREAQPAGLSTPRLCGAILSGQGGQRDHHQRKGPLSVLVSSGIFKPQHY